MVARNPIYKGMTQRTNNPLLDFTGLPRFDEIEPRHIEVGLDQLLSANRMQIEKVATAGETATWDSFIQPIEDTDEKLDRFWSPVSHLHAVMDSDAMRAAYEACLPKLSDYQTEVSQDKRLFDGYQAVANSGVFKKLDQSQKKIIENALRDFRLSGVDLESEAKQRFKEISQELTQLTNRFEQNLLDATNAWSMHITDEKKLAGLPQSALAVAQQTAEQEELSGWKFTLHAPSYIPFMTYADDRLARREFYEAYTTRASEQGPHAGKWDNSNIMLQLLRLRKEAAALIGFDNYAEYSMATKMARDAAEVEEFLLELVDKSKPAAEKEMSELRLFAKEKFAVENLEAWDLAYYSEKLRQERYDFTQEDVRPYFPVDKVLNGMFDVVGRLFGIHVRPAQGVQQWHKDVEFFEIYDENDVVRGQFYVDLYARSHKRGGAWMADCISRKRMNSDIQTPVAFLTCNFTPPVGDKPALLTHDEVTTLFHEFGHGLHHMLTRVDYVGVAGISGVAWDAVELPSQFLENWCWEREALDIISNNVDTGEPLPDELLKKMRAAKNFQAAMQMVRQLEFSLFDLRLHTGFDAAGDFTIQQLLDSVREEVAVVKPPAFNRFQHSFSHIFAGGYAAGYYSYKWAEVLSADAFSKFEEDGIFNADTGRSFLGNILEKGGSQEPLELFVAFRGREPTVDALLRHSGLAA